MSSTLALSHLKSIFLEEASAAGAGKPDVCQHGTLLFARAVLPAFESDVRPRDKIRGGVAMRADDQSVSFHPFIFRLVCKNGAVMARSVASMCFAFDELIHEPVTEEELREAIRCSARREIFLEHAQEIRASTGHRIDRAISMLSMLSRLAISDSGLSGRILAQFLEEERTAFGLMNAVTSVARDTRDPETKWRLEELGGSIPALLRSPKGFDSGAAHARARCNPLAV